MTDGVIIWGNYAAVHIRLFSKNKLLTPYTELFYCNNKGDICKLSNRMHRINKDFSFFTSAIALVSKSNKVEYKEKEYISVFQGENKNSPIRIKINVKPIDTLHVVKGSGVKPLALEGLSDNVYASLKIIENFVRNIWNEEGNLDFSKKGYAKDFEVSGNAYKKYWGEDHNNKLITNYTLLESNNSQKENELDVIPPHSSTNYTGSSFIQRLSSWTSYKPVAYLVEDDVIFTWVEYKKVDNSVGYLLFSFSIKQQKLMLATSSNVGRLLVKDLIARKLGEFLQ